MARRRRRVIVVDFERLLAADRGLADADARWRAEGYSRSSARLWRCKDGSFTARIVWRQRGATLSTITYVVRGLA
ncbi:MAG: hypothetical protein AB7U62_17675 [Pseudolabrys sp.]